MKSSDNLDSTFTEKTFCFPFLSECLEAHIEMNLWKEEWQRTFQIIRVFDKKKKH